MAAPHNPKGPLMPHPYKKSSLRKGLGFFPNSIARSSQDPITEMVKTAPQISTGQLFSKEKSTFFCDSGSTIPLFNMEHLATTTGSERNRLIQALGIGLTQVGFVAIKAENLIPLIDQVHKEMRRYFHQPFEYKILDWRSNETRLGYSPRTQEQTDEASSADIKETFCISKNFRDWPRGRPSFARVLSQYYYILEEYARHLVMYIMAYLGQPQEEVKQTENSSKNLLHLMYYPSIKPNDDPKALWAAPHCDSGLLTISPPGTIPGLQFLSNHNQWQPVIVPEGFLILNTGLQLQHKTAGLIKARMHRIVNPGGPYTRMERFASGYTCSWPEEYSLAPFENCVALVTKGMSTHKKRIYLEEYADITVAEKAKTKMVFNPGL